MTSSTVSIRHAESDAELAACFPVMRELRPHLGDAGELAARVRRQAAEGYRVLALWQGEAAVACAGYRIIENLHRGRHMYVDDLVTADTARSRGHGDRLFDALVAEAKAQGCGSLTLDAALPNAAGHRFYFRKRMAVTAFRFARPLD
jgi:GNAT superfamily N-acetyltransferase